MTTLTLRQKLGALGIVLLTLAAYIPAIQAGFVWDDNLFLTENPLILADDGLQRFWFSSSAADYFPLASSTLWFEWRIWGHDATGYHVTNILLHIVSSLLLWAIFAQLGLPGAWFAAVIFAVHPVNVEAVAWITQRKNTLALPFMLVATWCYLRHEQRGGAGLYVLSVLSFVLALLSKTAVVPLPAVLLMLAWWQRGRVMQRDMLRSLPLFAVAAALAIVTILFQSRAIGETIVRDDGLVSRTLGAGCAVWFYLGKSLLPVDLIFVYPRWHIDVTNIRWYLPIGALLAMLATLWLLRGRIGRGPVVALSCFILMLSPVLGFFNIYFMLYSFVADHWQYFALPCVIALVVAVGAKLLGPRVGVVFATLVLALLLPLTWLQAGIYRDEATLWRDTIAKNPTAGIAYYNLARIVAREGDATEAISLYDTLLEIEPYASDAHYNLAILLEQRGEFARAMHHFAQAAQFKPGHFNAHARLARLLETAGRLREAMSHYEKASDVKPDWDQPRIRLAWILATHVDTTLRDGERAVILANQALQLTHEHRIRALDTLAAAYAEAGDFEQAVLFAEQARHAVQQQGNAALATSIEQRLSLYHDGQPFRDYTLPAQRPQQP